MLKLVVYDLGWGGELVADYLEQELQTLEVVRVNGGASQARPSKKPSNKSGGETSLATLYEHAVSLLAAYFGKVDLIILGGYTVSELFEELCQNYPAQTFVKLDIDLPHVLGSRNYPRQVALLMGKVDIKASFCQALRAGLPTSTLLLPDCRTWEQLIDNRRMNFEEIYRTFAPDFILRADAAQRRPLLSTLRSDPEHDLAPARRNQYQPDTVILLSTHFWAIKTELEQLFGYKTRVLDFRKKLLHDVCRALHLRGVDGRCRH